MSDADAFTVGPNTGRRALWLFALHVPADDIDYWEPPRPTAPPRDWPLEEALGVGALDPVHVQVFPVDDLGPMGLRRYLSDALGMDEEAVETDAATLDRLHGTAVIVQDRAITDRPAQLTPSKPLRFIGFYAERPSLVPADPMPTFEAARGLAPGATGPTHASEEPRRSVFSGAILAVLLLAALAALVWALA